MVFYGEYIVSITDGCRIALPKKIREILTNNVFVLTKGFGTCLAGYDKRDWENRAGTLLNVSLLDKDQIDKRRYIFSSTLHIELDDQGRAVLPKNLLQFAKLIDSAVIVGVGDHFEIWSKDSWGHYINSIEKS